MINKDTTSKYTGVLLHLTVECARMRGRIYSQGIDKSVRRDSTGVQRRKRVGIFQLVEGGMRPTVSLEDD